MAEGLILDPSREAAGAWPVRNLVTNPAFEVDTAGWGAEGGCSIARTTAQFLRGVAALRATLTGAAQTFIGASVDSAHSGIVATLPAGRVVSVLIAIRPSVTFTGHVLLLDSGGSWSAQSPDVAYTANQWQWIRVQNVNLTSATGSGLRFLFQKAAGNFATSDFIDVDCAMIVDGATIGEYVDGAQPGCVWEGTPNASASRQLGPVNHVQNPSAEIDLSSWHDSGTVTRARTTLDSKFGMASMRHSANGAGGGGFGDMSLVTGGVTYTFGVWLKATAGAPVVSAQWLDRANAFISATPSSPAAVAGGGWTLVTVTATAPLTADHAIILITAPGANADYLADAALFVAEAAAGSYFDGENADSPPDEPYWFGTRHNSASFLIVRRQALDINPVSSSPPLKIAPPGPDWGDSAIETFMADGKYGSSPVDYRMPNRTVTIPILIFSDAARASLQSKAATLRTEGGVLKRSRTAGDLYADVVNAKLTLPDSAAQARGGFEPEAVLELECLPDFYGAERALPVHSETTLPELTFTEAGILGNYPSRLRALITELQGVDQASIIFAPRARNYDADGKARLAYEAEALTVQDSAAIATRAGASGGGSNNVVRHSSLLKDWTPILASAIAGVGELTHRGTYRVLARVYSTAGATVSTRLGYNVGDLRAFTLNDAKALNVAAGFTIIDYGTVNLIPTGAGAHRWQFQIQAKGTAGGEDFDVDRVWLVPVDEGLTIVRAAIPTTPLFTAYSAVDRFDQTAGALAGKTPTVGGIYGAAGGAGADWNVDATNHWAARTAVSDVAGLISGKFETLATPATLAAGLVSADFGRDNEAVFGPGATVIYQGVVLRYTNASNCLLAVIASNAVSAFTIVNVQVIKLVAGTPTVLYSGPVDSRLAAPGSTTPKITVQLAAVADGKWAVYWQTIGSAPVQAGGGFDVDLATGGVLASGKVGIFDQNTGAGASTRVTDNFYAKAINPDAAIFASQLAQLTSDGNRRLDSAGAAYGPIARSEGQLPRLPTSRENRTLEVFLKASRGDLFVAGTGAVDAAIDDIQCQLFYRPCWITVPG